jgi:hypothetical protein
MTLGKNKGLQKKGKAIRKADRASRSPRKEWFKLISAPTFGNPKPIGWVPGNTTIGKKKAETNVENRICEVNYTDVAEGDKNQQHWRSVRIQVEKVENNCLYTSFVGMNCARREDLLDPEEAPDADRDLRRREDPGRLHHPRLLRDVHPAARQDSTRSTPTPRPPR